MERSALYQKHQLISFTQGLRQIYDHVLKPQSLDNLIFGPSYRVNTSKREQLIIHTANIKMPFNYAPVGGVVDEAWFFVAENKNNEIIGYRLTVFQKDRDENLDEYWYATGVVATAERGSGVAMPIELAHFDVLKRTAVLEWTPIVYRVEDGNLAQLKELEKKLKEKPSDDLKRLIEERRQEHERWLNLYGPQGRLGFDNRGMKTFVKRDYDFLYEIPFENLHMITIDRTDEREVGIDGIYAFPEEKLFDKLFLHVEKQTRYEKEILSKIKQILQLI